MTYFNLGKERVRKHLKLVIPDHIFLGTALNKYKKLQ